MPHSGGGGSSGGGSHGGGGHRGGSGTSRSHSYFPGSHHHVYFYKGKQVSYYSREPIPRTRPLFPVLPFIFAVLFSLPFVLGTIVPALVMAVPSYQKLPEKQQYETEYIDDHAGDIRLSATEEADIEAILMNFADETNIPVCFEIVDYDSWYGHYESLEKYAYQSYVTRWEDEDHYLIVLSMNTEGIREEGLSYVNQWRFETMIGDDLHCLTTKKSQVFNDAFTANLYQLSDEYPLHMALDQALQELNLSLHTKQKVTLKEWVEILFAVLVEMAVFGTVSAVIIWLPIKGYKEKVGEFEYYEKNGFPETREEMLARYTKAMHVLSICPNCGAPNDQNREICEYCNSNLLKK